jgi:glucose/mannose transport system substrate-binding protein
MVVVLCAWSSELASQGELWQRRGRAMKISAIVPLFVVGVAAVSGCSSEAATSEVAADRLELLTWWTQPTELAALEALIDVHEGKHANIEVTVFSAITRDAMDDELLDRLSDGNPPTAFQANLGGHSKRWAESAQSLNQRSAAWASAYQSSVLDLVTVDGELIGVPLAITRDNNSYYNKRVLDELELDIPQGNQGLLDWLSALEARGYTHPLCMGGASSWVNSYVLFESIVPAHGGAEFSRDYWSGALAPDDPTLAAALDFAASLAGYFNTDLGDIEMAEGVARLMEQRAPESQCVMTPMGDWGGAILESLFEVDRDFVQRAWPGTEDLFVMAGDAFITTVGVRNQQQAYAFFDTLASREGQIAFNAKKGSVPARTLAAEDLAQFGPLTRSNMLDFASLTVLPAYGVIATGEFPWLTLYRLAYDFWLTAEPTPIVDFMSEHYDKLATASGGQL